MNDIYKTLANKARDLCIEEFSGNTSKSTAWSWEEKFAKLVVEECVNVIPSTGTFFTKRHLKGKIKEHFGIE